MAYQTGTATGVSDLLDKLRVFMVANSWITDSDVAEGTGKRWHAHNGTVYANFRSYVAETPSTDIASSNNCTGLGCNIGTGYSGASAWYNQAGVAIGTASKYMTAGFIFTGAATAYHFFAHNAGANIVVVVEITPGFYQYLAFGSLTKYGAYAGGEYLLASRTGTTTTTYAATNGALEGTGLFRSEGAQSPYQPAFVTVAVDAETGWHWGSNPPINGDTTKRYIIDNIARIKAMWGNDPATLNSLTTITPVIVSVERDANHNTSTLLSPIGELPKLHYLRITSFTPAQQITFGATNYRVFPFFRKDITTTSPAAANGGQSSFWGFAVEE